MPTPLEQLARQAIALAAEDRARLSDLLYASLPGGADEPLGDDWDQEIRRRLSDVEAGSARQEIRDAWVRHFGS